MRDYQTFCFLENPKTGSTFVVHFLKAFANEPLAQFNKHRPVLTKQAGKLYFTTVREPLDSYLSLYNFGADGIGTIRRAVVAAGKGDLYSDGDRFDEWLRLFIDPDVPGSLPAIANLRARSFGLMTARFRKLACFGFTLAEPAVDHVLRFETLRDDLSALVEGHLAHAFDDVHVAVDWIRTTAPVNTSTRRERDQPFALRRSTIDMLIAQEKALYAAYYPEMAERLRAGDQFPGIVVEG